VTPSIDNTTYAQAAALNDDGSHGPLKCGTCHRVDNSGLPISGSNQAWFTNLLYTDPVTGQQTQVGTDFDLAVAWAHTATEGYDRLQPGGTCSNCHGWDGTAPYTDNHNPTQVNWSNKGWTEHTFKGRIPRDAMNAVEAALKVPQTNPLGTLCQTCHGDRSGTLSRRGCSDKWRTHLIEGRASEAVWKQVSTTVISGQPDPDNGSICGY